VISLRTRESDPRDVMELSNSSTQESDWVPTPTPGVRGSWSS